MAQIEIFHERARRRWTEADRRRLVAETLAPGATVHAVARRHGVNTSQLFTWRKQLRLELEPLAAPPTTGLRRGRDRARDATVLSRCSADVLRVDRD